MKNNIFLILLYIFLSTNFSSHAFGENQFNFDVTEVEILEEGNIVKGLKKGVVTTDDGIIIISNTFLYNKEKNILIANGNVEVVDKIKNIKIFSDNVVYRKNEEIITTNKNSKAIYETDKIITAVKFKYQKKENILIASENVTVLDKTKDFFMKTNFLTYDKNFEKLTTKGKTDAQIQSKYEVFSEDVTYLINKGDLSSEKQTKIKDDKSQIYHLGKFKYLINKEIVKGNEIIIISNFDKPKSDKFYFANAVIDLKNQKFFGKDTKAIIHKNVFDNPENDPRLIGVSAVADNRFTTVKKGVFTSCKETDDCPPWSLKAEKVTHDRTKKQLLYENAVLNIYDIPILYFPKFFHPDPTVERQSGLLKPEFNNSNILGSSITIPYFNVISDNKDTTFTPTLFDNEMLMSQIEYRQINEKSSFIADFGYVNNYTSSSDNNKKNLYHLFAKYNLDLELENYLSSDLSLSVERVVNDSYLKVFSSHITESPTLRPDFSKLENKFQIFLNHEKYNFQSGFETYETLNVTPSDRYQYILPYYKLDWYIDQNYLDGSLNLKSSGANDLNNTNKLETSLTNDLEYNSNDYYSNSGLKTNYNIIFKNLNSLGKDSSKYKSSPQIELVSLFNTELSLPLIKTSEKYTNLLTPKLSARFNPSDMKNYSDSNNRISINNIFTPNRLGLSDTFESGRSLTLGLDFKKTKNNDLNEINDYFQIKLATVLRDKKEEFIPKKSSLNDKHSNIFGSFESQLNQNFNLEYYFSIDNDYSTFEYNDINATLSFDKFVTQFRFVEENNIDGSTNVITNSFTYNHDEENSFSFNTRRNRKINLTEYYDLVYQYRNDCLVAGIKYNKTYYSDGDLKPTENLLFTISLVPLTTYEYKADQLVN